MFSYNKHSTRHVDDRNSLGDTNNEFNACAGSFHNGIGSTWRGNENATRVRIGSRFCLRDGIKNWDAFDGSAPLARSDTTDNMSSRGFHIARMKLTFAPGNTLY